MIGKPLFFNVDVYLACVEMMIQSDEVERAFWMMDNLPAYYRNNPPEKLLKMKEELNRAIWTPVQYAGIYNGQPEHPDFWPLRAQVTQEIVEANPGCFLMELAPGSKWLERGLKARDLKFDYESISLDDNKILSGPEENAKIIFCAFELIEHLSNPWEIYQNYLKFKWDADYVLISTPLYTYGGGMQDWRNNPLGHLRTYTPKELHETVAKMFQGYQWECRVDDTIVLIGRK